VERKLFLLKVSTIFAQRETRRDYFIVPMNAG